MSSWTLHCGDCLDVLPTLEAHSVALTVTSPPYNCGKDYGEVSDDLPWDTYWDQTRQWLTECLRVTKTGGRLAVNLPWWMGKKPRRDVPHEFKKLALSVGWLTLDKIIWSKGYINSNGWGTYLSPSGPSIRCTSELILIFAKDSRGRGVISGAGRGACVRGDVTPQEWAQWTQDVWSIKGASHPEHPATFPAEIPHRLIKLYTFPGETVLDPFMGTGTTGRAAQEVGRNFIGIEKSQRFYTLAQTDMVYE